MKTDKQLEIEVQTIDTIQAMCEESLSPEVYEGWIKAKEQLYENRHLKHRHAAGTMVGKHIDTCAKCGRDLRNEIHHSN